MFLESFSILAPYIPKAFGKKNMPKTALIKAPAQQKNTGKNDLAQRKRAQPTTVPTQVQV